MIDWCLTCQFEDYDGSEEPCINCVSDTEVEGNAKPTEYFPKKPPKPITNADRIRSMTDEELAEFIRDQIIDRNIGIPTETWLDWLKQEVSANDS